jgi:hypothetical protein
VGIGRRGKCFYCSEQFRPVMAAAADTGITITPWPIHRVGIAQTIRYVS